MANNNNKWDSQLFPFSNHNGSGNNYINSGDNFTNSISGLSCIHVFIDSSNTFFTVEHNNKMMVVRKEKITSFETLGVSTLIINTEDEIPYSLIFKNKNELISAENRLFFMLNDNPDPGCGISLSGNFSNDFSNDFNL